MELHQKQKYSKNTKALNIVLECKNADIIMSLIPTIMTYLTNLLDTFSAEDNLITYKQS